MISKIAKWGNSQGLRIDKNILQNLGLCIGDKVEIIQNENTIVLKPHTYNIDWYLQDYERPEFSGWEEYNEPKGREVW